MEEEIKNKPKPQNALDDDAAIASFAEYMSGEGSELVDPAALAAQKKKEEEAK